MGNECINNKYRVVKNRLKLEMGIWFLPELGTLKTQISEISRTDSWNQISSSRNRIPGSWNRYMESGSNYHHSKTVRAKKSSHVFFGIACKKRFDLFSPKCLPPKYFLPKIDSSTEVFSSWNWVPDFWTLFQESVPKKWNTRLFRWF